MAKYYGIRCGRKIGVVDTWKECQENVIGFPGAVFKSFPTKEEAENFVNMDLAGESKDQVSVSEGDLSLPAVYAFTDGSYNEQAGNKIYGYGGFLHIEGRTEDLPVRGHGTESDYVESRNVAGEVLGAIAAMEKAIELGQSEMTLFYDYEGVAKWPLQLWKANKPISQMYVKKYQGLSEKLRVTFVHVKAHTGIPGNEAADKMAKEEVGIV